MRFSGSRERESEDGWGGGGGRAGEGEVWLWETMTRMGLWSFTCVLPAEGLDEDGEQEWAEESEMEQPGTSYDSRAFSYTDSRKSKACSGSEFEGARGRSRGVNCSSGGAHMLACFRAGAINLVSLGVFSIFNRAQFERNEVLLK